MLYRYLISIFLISSSLSFPLLAAKPLLWNIPVECTKFIGREKYLNDISKGLSKGPVTLIGCSGIGKTSLAYQYAREKHAQYQIAWTFDASKDLNEQFVLFANELCQLSGESKPLRFVNSKDAITYVKNYLRTTTVKWILVFDDAKSYGELIDYFPETHGQSQKHIIITSLSTRQQEKTMPIDKFTVEESLNLLTFHFGNKVTDQDKLALADELEHHPFALRLSISHILFSPGMTVPQYIALFRTKNTGFWQAERAAIQNDHVKDNHKQLYTSIKMSLEKLKAENKASYDLLCFLSQLNHSKIEGKLIRLWIEKFSPEQTLAFGVLLDRAMITPLEENGTNDMYSVHNYTQAVILNDASDNELLGAKKQATDLFCTVCKGSFEDVAKLFDAQPNFVAHLKVLFGTGSFSRLTKDLSLEIKFLYYLYHFKRDYGYAFKFAKWLRSQVDLLSIGYTIVHAGFYDICSYMDYEEIDADAALLTAQKASNILTRINTPEAKKELASQIANNLGSLYSFLGDLENQEKCMEQCKEINQEIDNDFCKYLILMVEGYLFFDKGQFSKAEKHFQEVLTLWDKDHLFFKLGGHYVNSLLSLIYGKQDDVVKASDYAAKAYALAKVAADGNERCEIIARSGVTLARAKCLSGELVDAEKLAREAISIYNDDFHNDRKNRRQAYAHHILGCVLMAKGDLETALKEFQFAKMIYTTQMKSLAVDDVSELYLKMVELGIALKDDLLIQECKDSHIRMFGLSHPRSIEISKIIDEANDAGRKSLAS